MANAQGTLYLSYLGGTYSSGIGVDSEHWQAVSFTTGTAANGYNLDSLQIRIAGVSGTPSGFYLSLYDNQGGAPGSSLQPLSGPTPTGAGIYTFTASSLTLAPSTVYWAVATSPDLGQTGKAAYWAFYSDDYFPSDGWNLSASPNGHSFNGTAWNVGGGGSPFTIAINATAVPEPASLSLLGMGALVICFRRLTLRPFQTRLDNRKRRT